MIDRDRVRELKDSRPESDAGAARDIGELPWAEPAGYLMRMWTAPTLDEFDRMAKDFPRHFKKLRSIIMTQRQDPETHDGWHLRDHNLENALKLMSKVASEAKCGDPSLDPDGVARRSKPWLQFQKLVANLRFQPR